MLSEDVVIRDTRSYLCGSDLNCMGTIGARQLARSAHAVDSRPPQVGS
jgi:hypothetical protein